MTKESTAINIDLIDQLLKDYKSPEDVLGENGLLKQLTKAVLERALKAELSHHLGYEKHSPEGKNSGNARNGISKKTLKGEFGTLPIEVPRDRQSSFEPKIVAKGQTRFDGFDDKILSLYARGMTVREIASHLANPFVLIGFALLLLFGVHRALISSGILPPVDQITSGVIVRTPEPSRARRR